MQSLNHQGKIIGSKVLDDTLGKRMKQIQSELNKKKVKSVRIGKIPKIGEEIEINSLKFRVYSVNNKKRRITLALL